MVDDYPERYPTGAGQEALAARLGLTIDRFSQDWEWEVADPARFPEWLAVYRDADLSDDERFSLMEMLVQCVESKSKQRWAPAQVEQLPEWRAVEDLLRANPRLHISTIRYWSVLEADDDPDHQFRVTGPMRRVWSEVTQRSLNQSIRQRIYPIDSVRGLLAAAQDAPTHRRVVKTGPYDFIFLGSNKSSMEM